MNDRDAGGIESEEDKFMEDLFVHNLSRSK